MAETGTDLSQLDGGADGGGRSGIGPTVAEVDPACVDGQYREVPPDPAASIDAELAGYSSDAVVEFINAVLTVRYPIGQHIFDNGRVALGFFDCLNDFLDDRSSGTAVVEQLSTLVHECGHTLNDALGTFTVAAYLITPDLTFECAGGNTQGNGPQTIARSLLNEDDYAALRPGCDCCGQGCDFYATLYLGGDPTNEIFEGGDQGFDSVLEEAAQYVNSLATAYAFNDFYEGFTSERDGILTFLWYIERYLRLTRLEHPDAYAVLSEDECWRNAILTVWGRAWLMLELTEDMSALGLDDDALLDLVRDEALLGEINRLRTAAGCP